MENKIRLQVSPPSALPKEEQARFCALVISEGEVTDGLAELVGQAAWLALLYDGDELIGTGGIKRPRPGYHTGVFTKSASDLKAADYPMEVGWLVVDESRRGYKYGWTIIDGLLEKVPADCLYATTRTGNEGMQYMLPARGFTINGTPYKSTQKPAEMILLYVRG